MVSALWIIVYLAFRSPSQRNIEMPKQHFAFRRMSTIPRQTHITLIRDLQPRPHVKPGRMQNTQWIPVCHRIFVPCSRTSRSRSFCDAVPFRACKKRWAFCKNNMAAFFGTRTGFFCVKIVGAVFVQWQVDVLDLGPTLPRTQVWIEIACDSRVRYGS